MTPPDTTRPGILIVEDDPDIRAMMVFALGLEGYQTRSVSNGAEALDLLRQDGDRVGLVLLDLMMPVMNGWEFRAEQVQDPRLREIPVVVISGDCDAEARQAELAVEGYLVKPVDLETLLRVVRRYF